MNRVSQNSIRSISQGTARIFGLLWILSLSGLPCGAQSLDEAFLDAPMGQVDTLEGREFLDLCRTLNRPCGIEEANFMETFARPKAPRRRLGKMTPRKILDLYVGRLPGYHWVIRHGVINVEPKKRTGKDVLARKLDGVSIDGITSFMAALDVLQQAKIDSGYQTPGRVRYAIVDLKLKNITVRDALNAIAKADGQVMWLLTSGKTGRTFTMMTWRESGATSIHERRKPGVPGEKSQ